MSRDITHGGCDIDPSGRDAQPFRSRTLPVSVQVNGSDGPDGRYKQAANARATDSPVRQGTGRPREGRRSLGLTTGVGVGWLS